MPLSDMQDAKEQVRQATDIVDLVGSYMTLRRQGRGYVAICPWHDDSRPSLQINPQRQSFKCWVCDIGGDIFSFAMRIEGLEFREALEMLAERAGIDLAPTRGSADRDSPFDRRRLLEVMAWAETLFHESLLQSSEAEPARRYLAERGINDASIKQFHLGFAPARWDWLLGQSTQQNFSPAVLERVGLVAQRQSGDGYYDRFRGRLMFSIRDSRSRPIAFGGRVLPGVGESRPGKTEAKYINSPETPLFNKSSQLYALDLARDAISREHGIVVMEGYTDVIMAHQHGITSAVAVLGTALGERHVPLVRRFTDRITLVLDGDEAGQKRTLEILDELLALFVSQEIDLKILGLPDGADPCDVIASQGCEDFLQLLSTAVDALEYKIAAVTKGLASAPGTHAASQAVEDILGTLARAFPSGGTGSSSALIREQQVLSRLSKQFGVEEETMRMRMAARRRTESSRRRRGGRLDNTEPAKRNEPIHLSAWDRELVELLLHRPEALPRLAELLPVENVADNFSRKIYQQAIQIMHEGQVPTFDQIMLSTEDLEEISLLVDCDERGRDKATSDTDQLVADLVATVHRQQQASRHQAQKVAFHEKTMDPNQEDEQLNSLMGELKARHNNRRQTGIAPTDG